MFDRWWWGDKSIFLPTICEMVKTVRAFIAHSSNSLLETSYGDIINGKGFSSRQWVRNWSRILYHQPDVSSTFWICSFSERPTWEYVRLVPHRSLHGSFKAATAWFRGMAAPKVGQVRSPLCSRLIVSRCDVYMFIYIIYIHIYHISICVQLCTCIYIYIY